MSKLMIVTHCWAVEHPLYAVLLRAQLTSLAHNSSAPKVAVCYDPTDAAVCNVIRDFSGLLELVPYPLQRERMWRRSIARNDVAVSFQAEIDLFWYADCDYLFGGECLETLLSLWEGLGKPELVYPRHVYANADKAPVDKFCSESLNATGMIVPPEMEAVRTKLRRAIGGVLITSSEYLKQHGYLPAKRWQTPPPTPFPDFHDDPLFREKLLTRGRCARLEELPGLYRLRHTEIGYLHK